MTNWLFLCLFLFLILGLSMIANFKKPSHLQPWLKLQFHFPIWREWASKACDIFRQRNPKWNPLLEVSTALVGCAGIFPTAPDLHNTGSELIRFKSNPEIVNLSQMKSHVLELWAILVFTNTQKRKHKKKAKWPNFCGIVGNELRFQHSLPTQT